MIQLNCVLQHDRQSEDLYVKQTCEAPNSYEIQSCNPVLDNKENLYSPVTSCEISARNPVKQVSLYGRRTIFNFAV